MNPENMTTIHIHNSSGHVVMHMSRDTPSVKEDLYDIIIHNTDTGQNEVSYSAGVCCPIQNFSRSFRQTLYGLLTFQLERTGYASSAGRTHSNAPRETKRTKTKAIQNNNYLFEAILKTKTALEKQ